MALVSTGDRTYDQLNAAMHAFAARGSLSHVSVNAAPDPLTGLRAYMFSGDRQPGGYVSGVLRDRSVIAAIDEAIATTPGTTGLQASTNDTFRSGPNGSQPVEKIRITYEAAPVVKAVPQPIPIDGRLRIRGAENRSVSADALDNLFHNAQRIATAATVGADAASARSLSAGVVIAIAQGYGQLGPGHTPAQADRALTDTLAALGFGAKTRVLTDAIGTPAGVGITAMPYNAHLAKAVLEAVAPQIQNTRISYGAANGAAVVATFANGTARFAGIGTPNTPARGGVGG